MNKKLLNQFFKDNSEKSDIPSAAAMTHFSILLEDNTELKGVFNEKIEELIFSEKPNRKEKVMETQKIIESITSWEEIVKLMRRGVDTMCQSILINKALEYEDELIPDVLKRFKTSLNVSFIENAVRVLARCNKDIADEIHDYYDDMRSPYAQSLALLVLGFKADDTYIPWLIDKHDKLKRSYPNENYHEGAYYALYEIERRFDLYDGN